MALVVKDRVRETSTTTGTGTLTLAGAVTGFDAFTEIGNTNTTYFTIVHRAADEWETALGTYTASGTTLSRTTVLASSNNGSATDFSAGTKDVFCVYPAGKAVFADAAGAVNITNVAVTGGSVAGITDLAVADGGTGASDAGTARTNLGLGTIATQASDSVDIDGGAIDGITLGTNTAVTDARIDNLQLDANALSSTNTNGNVQVAANGTGYLEVRGNTNAGKVMLNCESNSHGVSIASPPHSAGATYDLTLPTSLSAGALYTSSGGQLSTGDLPVADGGTGASDAGTARTNLGLGTMATAATSDYLALAGGTLTGQLVAHSTGIQFSDGTTQTTAGSGGGLTVQDEGSALSTQAQTLNFVGSGVTASGTGATKTITISGAGGGVSTGKAIAMAMIFG